jgi:hypothetical protein
MWTPGRMKNSIYHAHEFYKTIKNMAKIYILSALASPSWTQHRQGGKFELFV